METLCVHLIRVFQVIGFVPGAASEGAFGGPFGCLGGFDFREDGFGCRDAEEETAFDVGGFGEGCDLVDVDVRCGDGGVD